MLGQQRAEAPYLQRAKAPCVPGSSEPKPTRKPPGDKYIQCLILMVATRSKNFK